jgi:diacylglycerol kinase family enzyme
MRALLVHNPKAGVGICTADELQESLRSAGISLVPCDSAEQPFPKCMSEPVDMIIAAGGDGTIAKTIRKLPDRSIPLGILPIGTANNIAHSLGIAGKPDEIIGNWSLNRTRTLDIGVVHGEWGKCSFVEAVGVGSLTKATQEVDAALFESKNPMRKGRLALAKQLATTQPEDTRLTIDGQEMPDDLLLLEIMNITRIGPALDLAPAADPGDGLLDVVCVRTEQREAMLQWLEAPDHQQVPLTVHRGREVSVVWRGTPLRVDDRVLNSPKDVGRAATRIEGSVKVLLP